MEQRDLRRTRQDPAGDDPGGGDADPTQRRETVARLLRASRQAVDRALSGDSEKFNQAVQQPGGQ